MALIFLNRFYRPEGPATAQLLTDLAEALAADGAPVVGERNLGLAFTRGEMAPARGGHPFTARRSGQASCAGRGSGNISSRSRRHRTRHCRLAKNSANCLWPY